MANNDVNTCCRNGHCECQFGSYRVHNDNPKGRIVFKCVNLKAMKINKTSKKLNGKIFTIDTIVRYDRRVLQGDVLFK